MYKPTIKNIIMGSAIATISFFSSCKKADEPTPTVLPLAGANGFYVINEGSFMATNASLSFFDKSTKTMTNDYYKLKTGEDLGDQGQSMTIYKEKGYIVVQNSNKVVVVDMGVFSITGNITGITGSSPRYFIGVNENTGYISDWNTDALFVINLSTRAVTSSIAVGKDPDQMAMIGNKVFVTNSGGSGISTDNTISVVNTADNTVSAAITVGINPSYVTEDKNNKLWVLCKGSFKADYSGVDAPGTLVRINPSTNTVEQTFNFALPVSNPFAQPANLTINKDGNKLLYNYEGKVFSQDVAATELNTTPLIERNFYGLAFDPSENQIIGCLSTNFTSSGKIIRYNFENNTTAIAADSFAVGVVPNGIAFK